MTAVFGNNVHIQGNLVVAGATSLSAVNAFRLIAGSATVSENFTIGGSVNISGTVVAANVAKAWGRFDTSAGITFHDSFNIAAVSRSAAGVYRITFTNAMANADYAYQITPYRTDGALSYIQITSVAAGSIKFHTRASAATITDADSVIATFYGL